ncbi:MAG TPA: hypothetical protein VFE24_17550 [Pirellulales bacterium]|nr:hypothetical protein [Pirellulales bacterium]
MRTTFVAVRRTAVAALLSAVCLGGLRTLAAQEPAAAPDDGLAKVATWQIPPVADVRAKLNAWLDAQKASDEIKAKAAALWPAEEKAVPPGEVLDRAVATFALMEPVAKATVDTCLKPRESALAPKFPNFNDEKLAPLVRDNLKLYVGRWLVQNQLYDESLAEFDKLTAANVLDPTSLLFYESVAYHWLLQKGPGLKAVGQLLERRQDLPRRYESLAELMQQDLRALKDDSLDHISRRMDDITRRLDLGRAGDKTRGVEDGVIASLDKLIDELEKQKNGGGGGSGQGGGQGNSPGNPQGIQSSAPASDSKIATGKAPGDVTKKPIGSASGWGDLPPKQREEALQQIGKDFPAHYRDAIEQYFRRLANEDSESGGK